MAAFIRHRRFMEDSTNIGDKICDFQCDPDHNPTGICFANCAATCPSFCHITDVRSHPPSSSPSPAFSPYSQTSPPQLNHRQLSFPLKISLTFLIATFVYTLYKIFTVWYRSRHQRMAPPPSLENQETLENNHDLDHHIWYIRTAGLQLSEINAITVAKYNKGDGFVVGTDCTVCLSEFEADEAVRLLPKCKHAFHVSCIDTWLGSHTNCPLCRAGIVNIDPPLPEQNSDDFGTNLRISGLVDDDREEASGSSELTVMETDEDDVNGNSEFFLIGRLEEVNGNSGMGFQSRDGISEIEMVKIEHCIDNRSPKIGG